MLFQCKQEIISQQHPASHAARKHKASPQYQAQHSSFVRRNTAFSNLSALGLPRAFLQLSAVFFLFTWQGLIKCLLTSQIVLIEALNHIITNIPQVATNLA